VVTKLRLALARTLSVSPPQCARASPAPSRRSPPASLARTLTSRHSSSVLAAAASPLRLAGADGAGLGRTQSSALAGQLGLDGAAAGASAVGEAVLGEMGAKEAHERAGEAVSSGEEVVGRGAVELVRSAKGLSSAGTGGAADGGVDVVTSSTPTSRRDEVESGGERNGAVLGSDGELDAVREREARAAAALLSHDGAGVSSSLSSCVPSAKSDSAAVESPPRTCCGSWTRGSRR